MEGNERRIGLGAAERSTKLNPLNRKKYYTDRSGIFALAIVLTFWVGIVIKALYDGVSWDFTDFEYYETLPSEQAKLHESLNYASLIVTVSSLVCGAYRCSYAIAGIILSSIFIMIFLINLRCCTKICAWFGIISILVIIIIGITDFFSISYPLRDFLDYITTLSYWENSFIKSNSTGIISGLIKILSFTMALVSINEVGMNAITDVLRKLIRGFFFYYSLIIFVLIVFVVDIAMLLLSMVVANSINVYISCIFQFASMYIFFFIYTYTKMVISPTISTWYWTKNKSEIPKTLFKYISVVTRHQIGTAALTALPILPFCLVIYTAIRHIRITNRNATGTIFGYAFTVYLIFPVINFSVIIASIHGRNLYQSTQIAFRLMTKKSALSFSIIHILNALCLVVAEIVGILAKLPLMLIGNYWFDGFAEYYYAKVFILPILLLLIQFGQVYLLCKIEDEEGDDESEENRHQMTQYLKVQG